MQVKRHRSRTQLTGMFTERKELAGVEKSVLEQTPSQKYASRGETGIEQFGVAIRGRVLNFDVLLWRETIANVG